MRSRPPSADTGAVEKLFTRLDVEAIDVSKSRTEMPAAVARLVQLVPPARLDLVDEVLVRVGRRDLSVLDWPPVGLVHQLAYRVKRVHLGEVQDAGGDRHGGRPCRAGRGRRPRSRGNYLVHCH
jgi:hypothetical protein